MTRWVTVALVLGLLSAGILYDRVNFAPPPEPLPVEEPVVTPVIGSDDALSTVWFCPVGSGVPDGYAAQRLAITNLGDSLLVAHVDLITDEGPGPGVRL